LKEGDYFIVEDRFFLDPFSNSNFFAINTSTVLPVETASGIVYDIDNSLHMALMLQSVKANLISMGIM